MALTECGEGFYQRARLILEELRAAQDDIRQRQGNRPGRSTSGWGQRFAQPDARRYHPLSCPTSAGQSADNGRAAGVDDQRITAGRAGFHHQYLLSGTLRPGNLRLKNSLRSHLRYFVAKGIRQRGQRRLTNSCIITGQCRRRGEVIISS